jgi:HEAT repeat protein
MGLFGPPRISELEAKRDVAGLIKALDYKNSNVNDLMIRRLAAAALGKIGDPRGVEPLAIALTAEDESMREYAAVALARSAIRVASSP